MSNENDDIEQSYTFFAGILLVPIVFTFISLFKRLCYKKKFCSKEYCNCQCKKCIKRLEEYHINFKKEKINITFFFYLILFIVSLSSFAFCAFKIQNYNKRTFDPYDILGISPGATKIEIKKAYKKLALVYHPDKAPNNKEKDNFININNAYKALTDDRARANYEKYGHPDGPGYMRLGLGIPRFLMKGAVGTTILFSFAALCLIVFPILFLKWVNKTKQYNNLGMLNIDQSIFYYFIDENTTIKELPFIFGLAKEFETFYARTNEVSTINQSFNEYKKYFPKKYLDIPENTIPIGNKKAITILYCHLYNNLPSDLNLDDYKYLLRVMNLLIENAINMCGEISKVRYLKEKIGNENEEDFEIKNYGLSILENIIKLSQCLSQRTNLSFDKYQFLELPHIKENHISAFKSINNISELRNNFEETLHKTSINNADITNMKNSLNSIPKYTITKDIKVSNFPNRNLINFDVNIKRIVSTNEGNKKLNGFNHSLTYPTELKEKILVAISKEEKIFSLKTFEVLEDVFEFDYQEIIDSEEEGKVNYTISLFSLNFLGVEEKESIVLDLKIEKKRGIKRLNIPFESFIESYLQPIPYLDYSEQYIEDLEDNNDHIKKE